MLNTAVREDKPATQSLRKRVEEEDDGTLNLDVGLIQRFGRLNITAPIGKEDLPKTIKELHELKLAFFLKGDEERKMAKAKFLRECGREVPQEDEKNGENSEVSEEKFKQVERILQSRRQGPQQTQQRRRRRDDDDDIDIGEEGIDIDTYEAKYGGQIDAADPLEEQYG